MTPSAHDPRQVPPQSLPPQGVPPQGVPPQAGRPPADAAPYDPLRLCIFATVALLGWLLGPFALVAFAGLGVVGYAKARRAGLLRSKCLLGDTRVVLAYLVVLTVAGGVGIWLTNGGLHV